MMTKLLDLGRTPPFLARRICRIPKIQKIGQFDQIVELISIELFYTVRINWEKNPLKLGP